jgi:hypothetical protein
MFGFTLDIFSKMDTVGTLGLESRLLGDYTFFARDYFRWGWWCTGSCSCSVPEKCDVALKLISH